jgi:hypothetical protein
MRQRALSSLISSSMPLAARLWGSGSHPIGGARGVSLAGMAPTTRMLRALTGDLLAMCERPRWHLPCRNTHRMHQNPIWHEKS